jgi:high-affinity iron transporter
MFANFLIGLREGLEAALIVAILIAYLVALGQRQALRLIWLGICAAIALSLGFGAFLHLTSQALTFTAQETFGGVMSIVAVGLITWMIMWMALHSRQLRGRLHGELDKALLGSGWAIAVVAFVAVIREGLETALFLWAGIRASGSSGSPLVGALLGLAVSVVLGIAVYRGAVRMNISRLFTWTGAALIIVAAGVLAYGMHDLQEAGILPGLNSLAFDVSAHIPPGSWYGTLLKGIFNFSPATTWLEFIAWWLYVIPVLFIYVRIITSGSRTPHHKEKNAQPQPA